MVFLSTVGFVGVLFGDTYCNFQHPSEEFNHASEPQVVDFPQLKALADQLRND